MTSEPKMTMEDVAMAAGVSIGTVDRVIHNREDVSEKTRAKVLKVIDEIGYKPNIYASILSQKKQYTIIVIIPYFQKGEFWELVYSGITKAMGEALSMNIHVKVFYYNQFEYTSFRATCRNALEAQPNGVLMAPIYKEEASAFMTHCASLSIPVAFIDTKITDSDYLVYFGPPLYESGYLAADLLVGPDKGVKEVVCFNIDRGELPPNDSISLRHQGFEAYLREYNPDCTIHDVWISPFDFLYNVNLMDAFFAEHPAVDHLVTFSSRAHQISDWMDIRAVRTKKLLGFDMLERNMNALRKGRITTLIADRTDLESYRTLKALIDHLVLKQKPANRDNYSSIDILNRYNVDFYLVRD